MEQNRSQHMLLIKIWTVLRVLL